MTNEHQPNAAFAAWLSEEMHKRGWSARELAARAGVAHSSIGRALDPDPERAVGVQVATAIAKALGLPQEVVLRRAKILERRPEMTYETQFLVNVYERLAAVGRQDELMNYAEYLLRQLQPEDN